MKMIAFAVEEAEKRDIWASLRRLPHMAYFTDQAVEDMVHNSLIVTYEYFREESPC